MEETTETAAIELEANLLEEQQQSDSMDGPSHTQNQEASNAMEENIDIENGDVNTDEDATSDDGGQDWPLRGRAFRMIRRSPRDWTW